MRDALLHARAALDQLLSDQALVDRAAAMPAILAGCLNKGGKILTCGN
ncbi:MAG: phosphoheptose isomerase, partial [Phycisphaerae bacterium]|nr:phosphoheptose isomerase [Phycisphaerae bacterium]